MNEPTASWKWTDFYLFISFFLFFFGKNQPIMPKNISKEVKSEKCNI